MDPIEHQIHNVEEEEDEVVEKEEAEEKSIQDALVDLLPFKMHVKEYKFRATGTKLSKHIKQGDVGINPLNENCHQHDIAYNEVSICVYARLWIPMNGQ